MPFARKIMRGISYVTHKVSGLEYVEMNKIGCTYIAVVGNCQINEELRNQIGFHHIDNGCLDWKNRQKWIRMLM